MRRLPKLLFLAIALSGQVGSTLAERPNVLFIATDDLRTNLGSYGDPVAITPHMDKLAADGVRFDRAYCQQALCNPSRSSLLTGRRPDSLRLWNLSTHFRETMPDVVTLPQHFKNNGYFTQGVGKIFHNWRTKIKGDPVSWSVPAMMHFATHSSDVAVIDGGDAPPNTARTPGTEARDVPDEAYFDGRIAVAAIKALRDISQRDEPFFLGVGFWKPHTPFNPPQRYWDLYDPREIPAVSNPNLPFGAPTLAMHDASEGMGTTIPGSPAERELRHGYYAATSFVDAQIGKVVDELKRLDLADNTIIVLWSDHGFHLGEHGLWGKTSNFELDARVPLIVVAPGFDAGDSSSALVELLDLYPTLVDLCDLPSVPELEGQSLVPLLHDPSGSGKSAAFTQHPRPSHIFPPGEVMGYSMRTDRFRYTEWRDWQSGDVVGLELYDHEVDSDETINLAGHAAHLSSQRDLASRLGRQFPRQGLPAQ